MGKASKRKFSIFIPLTIAFVIVFALFLNNSKVDVTEEETNVTIISENELETEEERFKGIEVGQTLEFGRYYSTIKDGIAEKDNIKWKVLDIVDDSALLMSCEILKNMQYHEFWNAITWETCSLRKWLNNDFYDLAFDDSEKEYIKIVDIQNTGNEFSGIVQDFVTKDRVFLLSIDEAEKYFDQFNLMMTVGTEYAKDEGLWISKYASSVGYSVWWLRSPGKTQSYASLIHAGGSIGTNGDGVATRGNGIRPCIWVKVR